MSHTKYIYRVVFKVQLDDENPGKYKTFLTARRFYNQRAAWEYVDLQNEAEGFNTEQAFYDVVKERYEPRVANVLRIE